MRKLERDWKSTFCTFWFFLKSSNNIVALYWGNRVEIEKAHSVHFNSGPQCNVLLFIYKQRLSYQIERTIVHWSAYLKYSIFKFKKKLSIDKKLKKYMNFRDFRKLRTVLTKKFISFKKLIENYKISKIF